MKTHLPHPKCPGCSRSLFKSATVGTIVKPSMPYAFCRNVACSYRIDSPQSMAVKKLAPNASKAAVQKMNEQVHKSIEKLAKKSAETIVVPKPIRKAVPAAEHKAKSPAPTAPEPDVVAVARARVAQLIKAFGNEIGLVLALANQETGHNEAANVLIDEYNLTARFGLEKF